MVARTGQVFKPLLPKTLLSVPPVTLRSHTPGYTPHSRHFERWCFVRLVSLPNPRALLSAYGAQETRAEFTLTKQRTKKCARTHTAAEICSVPFTAARHGEDQPREQLDAVVAGLVVGFVERVVADRFWGAQSGGGELPAWGGEFSTPHPNPTPPPSSPFMASTLLLKIAAVGESQHGADRCKAEFRRRTSCIEFEFGRPTISKIISTSFPSPIQVVYVCCSPVQAALHGEWEGDVQVLRRSYLPSWAGNTCENKDFFYVSQILLMRIVD